MRIGVVADVHGNLAALEAALAALREAGARRIVCCGDLVGRGPQPAEVVDRILEGRITCVRGTFDEDVAHGRARHGGRSRNRQVRWAAEKVGRKRRRALSRLPVVRELRLAGRLLVICHGTPRDVREGLFASTPASVLQDILAPPAATGRSRRRVPDVLICGGSHEPFVRVVGDTLVVNAGTVGSSDDGDVRSHAAIVELGPRVSARVLRVPYDLRRAVASARRLPRSMRKEWVADVLALSAHAERGADVTLSTSSPASEGAAVLVVAAARPLALATHPRKVSELRELRTAALRLRELLAAFGPFLPEEPAQRLDRRARKLFRALAAPRDAAVTAAALERLRGSAAAHRSAKELARRLRADARSVRRIEKVLRDHAGLRFAVLAGDAAPRAHENEDSLAVVSERALAARMADVVNGTPMLDLPHAHAAHHARRKAIRRLHLALELFGPWARSPASVLSAARAAQDALGEVRDLALAERQVRRELAGPVRRELLLSIGERRLLALREAAVADDRLVASLRDRVRGAA